MGRKLKHVESYYQRNKEKVAAQRKQWQVDNPQRIKDLRHRGKCKQYGLVPEQYTQLLERQNGVCAICGHPPKTRRLGVDHDHKTGRVRALLCHTCNKLRMGMNTLETARLVVTLLESDFDGRNIGR